jgi:xanthine dehydrogenase accessory factor
MLEFGVSDDEAFAVGLACGGRIRVWLEPVGAALPEAMLADLVAARAARRPVAYVVNTETGERRLDGPQPWADRFRADRSGMEEDGATFVHVHNPPLRMIVVGAVHIAQALLPMARMAGYDVSLSTRAPPSRRRRGFPARRWWRIGRTRRWTR